MRCTPETAGPRLALLTCHGGCAHGDDDLRHLAADLDDHGTGRASGKTPDLPPRLPGAPGIDFAGEGERSVIRRHDTTTYVSWDVTLDRTATAALAAYAVRLTAS
jgi:hypothetical protein